MTNDEPGRQTVPPRQDGKQAGRGRRTRLYLMLVGVAAVLVLLIVPPMISIGRYKSRITQVLSQSFGRPVRLASVELRLLPWPGFVLSDLSVAEDPAYGSEPVLHANSVTANIRLLPLWQGKLEISSVSVDEASVNVVRAAPGRWNLDPIFRTAAKAGPARSGQPHRFPYLEATNSRVNFKNGAEKLPFSVVDTDLSLWQESAGEWRLRLRGQPARTDVALDMGDTGIVRLEASVHRAPELRQMPLHVDIDWRQAQLGQLSRLLIGYDPGWRGDLTGELHLDGTPDAAQVTTRLRAAGVHRAEFAPASPLDFDAQCGFVYHYSSRGLDHLSCNSPLGDGRLRLTGAVPGAGAAPNLTVELDQISAGAGLDVLRTLRSGINPDLEAEGTISGKLVYGEATEGTEKQGAREQGSKGAGNGRRGHAKAAAQGPLTGSLTVEGFALSGGSLSQPLRAPKMVLQPALVGAAAGGTADAQAPEALTGTLEVPAGGTTPLTVNLKLALYGYEAAIHGPASLARARELAQLAGKGGASMLNDLAGEPLTASLIAEGPWMASEAIAAPSPALGPSGAPRPAIPAPAPGSTRSKAPAGPEPTQFDRGLKPPADSISGTIVLRNANWHADYLANHVQIAEATLHLGDGMLRWDPVVFSYGPVKGTASVSWPLHCAEAEAPAQPSCAPHFAAQFGSMDAGVAQAAFLGAHEKSTLLSDLIDRLHPASAPLWPAMDGSIAVDALTMGPLTLARASATVKIEDDHAEVSGFTANALGGRVEASGAVRWPANNQAGPAYAVQARFDGLNAAALGQLLGAHWSGGPVTADGKMNLSGFTGKDLAASAKGTLHFDWRHGGMASVKPLAHFEDWSGNAVIGDGRVTLGDNQVLAGASKMTLEGAVTLGKPAKAQFAPARR